MVAQYKLPGNVITENARTPHWYYTNNVQNADIWGGASEGDDNLYTHPRASASIPQNDNTDGLKGNYYGFTIPLNARIDGITAIILRSGSYTKDTFVSIRADGSYLANKAKSRQRTDENLLYDIYGGNNDKWGSSILTPAIVNASDFGVVLVTSNLTSSSKTAYVYVLKLKAEFTNPVYSLSNNIPSYVVVGSQINYQIVLNCTNGVDQGVPIPVNVPIPSGFNLLSATSNEGIYNEVTSEWNPILNSQNKATLNITLEAVTVGVQSQTVTETEFNTTVTESCEIVTSDPGSIYYTDAVIDDAKTLANLKDGEIYTISAYNQVNDTGIVGIFDGIKNNRITVINGDIIYGGRVTAEGEDQRVSVSFRYNSMETLTIRLYGQYQSISNESVDEWAGLTIKEGYDDTYSEAGNLLDDPERLLENSTYGVLTIPVNSEITYSFLIDTIPEQVGMSPFWKGLQLLIDVENGLGSSMAVQIISSNGNESNVKSSVLNSNIDQIIFGDEDDLWGLASEDINLHELEIILKFSNASLSEITTGYKNIILLLYWQNDETNGALGFTKDGTHSRNRHIFMKPVNIPEGSEKEINKLELRQRDGDVVVGMDIRSLEVPVEFVVYGTTPEEARTRLQNISKWLKNKRNRLGVPIPSEYIFDMAPNKKYVGILAGKIEAEEKYTSYECKFGILVPDGVVYNTEPKITGAVGTNEGEVPIRPVIIVECDGSSSVELEDTISGDAIIIEHEFSSGDIITIDCKNRTVTDQDNVDHSTSINYGETVWFKILDDYDINCSGGNIQNVIYYEAN